MTVDTDAAYTLKSGNVVTADIVIAAGSTSGTLTLTAVNNHVDAVDNFMTVGGTTTENWLSTVGASLTIKDDDRWPAGRGEGVGGRDEGAG